MWLRVRLAVAAMACLFQAMTAAAKTQAAEMAPAGLVEERTNGACLSQDTRSILVCGQRPQGYRLDPSVMEASQEADRSNRSASSVMPVAQTACSNSPMGCPDGLKSLDWANVAIVAATTAVRAAKGDDWTRAFTPGGSSEYQLYQQAKRRHEARAAERAAAAVKTEAEEAEREAALKSSSR